MRIDVKKVLILGPTSHKREFFRKAQTLGVTEFIRERPESIDKPTDIQNFTDALHVLRTMVPVKQAPQEDYHSAHVLARATIEHQERLEHLLEKKRVIEKEISRIEPFGAFNSDDLHAIEKETERTFQFFFSKKFQPHDELIHIASSQGLEYYVSISQEKKTFDGYIEIVINRSASELKEEIAEISREVDHLEIELASMAHHKELLKKGLINALNRYHLRESVDMANSLIEEQLFAVEAWVPKNKFTQLEGLAQELELLIEQIKIEKKDRRPTYLENKRASKLGEDLISIYDTPSTTDRDPSLWVYIAFGIFFSMIVADAGYGLIIFAISLALYFKFGKKKPGLIRRFSMLCLTLSIGCIFWGVMLSSFFGIPIAPDSPIRKVSVVDYIVKRKASYLLDKKNEAYQELVKNHPESADSSTPMALLMSVHKKTDTGDKYVIYDTFTDNFLIELAIFIGFIHLSLSFLRYLDRTWSGLGWVLFMVGGYLYFPSIIHATSLIYYLFGIPQVGSPIIGLYIMFSGLGLAVILALVQNRLAGAAEIMQVIQVFADVMSYLRIYALSLAGMIMGTTFDHIGTSMPLYIGVFVIFAGHMVNFTLALMGGVIHGLRLNFIEWYHYSFEGGGRALQPLKLIEID
ncbi:MAG: hypothetical protein S4CHLAM45_03030 [Chlamydiales bacterium]|nr:hypothetical protein [Chlamydiales bacterium]MCH9619161.1 hypothetical protein [Chlamydiales bacterium]MCH9622423.1 hypothetical protein [Chlamydiales bacterium]